MTTHSTDGRLYGPAGWTEPVLKRLADAGLIPTDYETDNFHRFSGVSGHMLVSIVDSMEFPEAALEDRQNDGPNLTTVLEFARAYPDFIKVSGYVVTEARQDERLTIDEIDLAVPTRCEASATTAIALVDECPLSPPDSRNTVLSGGVLHVNAWWD